MPRAAARFVGPAVAFGATHALAILVGRATRVDGTEVSLVWPAAAVAVLWGIHARTLPRPAAAAHWILLTGITFGVNLATGAAVDVSVYFAVVNLTLAAVTSALLAYGDRPVQLRDPLDLGRLAMAILAGTLVAATAAVAFFAARGHPDLPQTFALFAVRNGTTALVGTAVVLRMRHAQWRVPEVTPARVVEAVCCAAFAVAVFGRVFWFNPGMPTAFVIMVPAMWVSLRFSTTTSTLFASAAGTSIIWATLLDRGVLRGVPPDDRALLAQGMVGCLTGVVLALALFRDSRNELIEQLRHLAHHDPLTGLANRTLLVQRLESALERPRPAAATVGVVYIDLDGFKLVNDAWGHREGDLLLQEVARRVRASVRPVDVVARMGGDEFVVACLGLSGEDELREIAERIRVAVSAPYGAASDAPFDRISASVGVALSGRNSTTRSLLAAADRAMYDAKRAGRAATAPLTAPGAPSAR